MTTSFGGEKIGALVFDLGSQSFRVGYSQEDTPQWEIPAVVGVSNDGTADTSTLEPGVRPGSRVNGNIKCYIDVNSLCVPREGEPLRVLPPRRARSPDRCVIFVSQAWKR